ncbi:MAG: WD40 repeat domain-containing protein, partial [Nonomuraea sp.]|nr:WD40 repeat domain-containing protein [Nonomuraea sp.]
MDEHLRGRTFLVVAVALLAFTGWGWWHEQDVSKSAGRVALAHRLALHAAELRDRDPGTARDLGLAALEIHADRLTRAGLTSTILAWEQKGLDADGADQVAVSGDGRLALATGFDQAQVVIRASGDTRVLGERKGFVRVSALSSDGRTALVAEQGAATTVWDLDDPWHPVRRGTLRGKAASLALTRDGRTAAVGGAEGTMNVWDLTDRARPLRRSVTAISGGDTEEVALSADGRTAVTSNDHGPVTIWDLPDPAHPVKAGELSPAIHTATALALSADGRTLVVARLDPGERWKSQAVVWTLAGPASAASTAPSGDPARPVPVASIEPFDAEITDVDLSADGRTALVVESEGGGSLWDLSEPSGPVRLAALPRWPVDPAGGALSADASIALTAGADGSGVSRWDLRRLRETAAHAARSLCEHGGRSMTRANWDRYTGGAKPSDYG